MARASTSLGVQEIYEDIIWFVLIKYMTFSWWVQTWCICDNTTHIAWMSVCLLIFIKQKQPDGPIAMHRPIFPFVAPGWRSCMHRCTRWANYTCTYSKHICMSRSTTKDQSLPFFHLLSWSSSTAEQCNRSSLTLHIHFNVSSRLHLIYCCLQQELMTIMMMVIVRNKWVQEQCDISAVMRNAKKARGKSHAFPLHNSMICLLHSLPFWMYDGLAIRTCPRHALCANASQY